MLQSMLSKLLSAQQKRSLKTKFNEVRIKCIKSILGYDRARLRNALMKCGVAPGDTLMVHANFAPDSGFEGDPGDLVNVFAELVGDNGNLLMVSLPFRGAAYDYLSQGKAFNVKKTLSMMGLVTELFRRRQGTLRSLHPTHPVLAYGKNAEWLVEGHERCLHPCGQGSPFEKFRDLKGKILFFDVSFGSITFFHYVEDLLKERLPVAVYDDRLFSVPAVNAQGESVVIQTYAFNRMARRRADKLEVEMSRREKIKRGRVGNSRFCMVNAEDVVDCFRAMVDSGVPPLEVVDGGNSKAWVR